MLRQLLLDYRAGNAEVQAYINGMEIYVLPVFNPDGYSFTIATGGNRMWRKTRKPNTGSSCIGTDPNRNWNNNWGLVGISRDPCSETFCGSAANSEIEVRTVSNYLVTLNQNSRVKGYINFHAYSQLWLTPFGYTSALPPSADNTKIQNVARLAAQAIYDYFGMVFEYGPIYTTIYPASGSSADFAYQNARIIYSYAPELRDLGQYGFLLPRAQITPSGQETYEALKEWLYACLNEPF